MDAQTCLKKLQYIGVLNFATVDKYGKPQIRNISAIHFEQQFIGSDDDIASVLGL